MARKRSSSGPVPLAKRPATRRSRIAEESGSPEHDPEATTSTQRIDDLVDDVAGLIAGQDDLLRSYRDIHARFDSLEGALHERTVGPVVPVNQNNEPTVNGMNPNLAQSHFSWLDTTTITQIVAGSLDVAHLIKLIPLEDRPKGQTNTALPDTFTLNLSTGKTSVTNEQNIPYEKMFPNFSTFAQAITLYGAIRALYDTDNVGFGPAILTYIRQLAAWVQQGLPWTGILMYAIGHFRKYQSTHNISDWIDVDVQLYTAHIARAVIGPHDRNAASKEKEICNNFNTPGRGCNFKNCKRLHQCSTCRRKGHIAPECTTTKAPDRTT
jgi:hypothetical protein